MPDTGSPTGSTRGSGATRSTELVEALRAGRGRARAWSATVERVGAVLAEHAPPRVDDRDELPSRVILV